MNEHKTCGVAPLAAILRLSQNYPVFPCRRTATAKRKEKSPLTHNGFLDASQDEGQINDWWRLWPDALVGVPAGERTSLTVIDIDPRKFDQNGEDWLGENTDLLLTTRVHGTLHDGFHYVFSTRGSLQFGSTQNATLGGIRRGGIDIRGEGGYVIWWPMHGGSRTGSLSPIPAGLIDEYRLDNRAQASFADFSPEKWLADRDAVRDALQHIDPDCDRDTWMKILAAINLASGGSEDGFNLIHEWSCGSLNGSNPLRYAGRRDCAYTYTSFRHKGNRKTTLGTIFHLATAQGWNRAPDFDFSDVKADEPDPASSEEQGSEQEKESEKKESEGPKPLTAFDLWGKSPPVPALPRGLLPESIESFAFAKPNTFPPAALAMAALATCSMAASDLFKVEINTGWRERFTIWIALVGSSASGKSPVIGLALRPLLMLQTEAFECHEVAKEEWKARKKAAKNGDFDEPEPVCERFVTHNATIEALTEIERTTQHGLGLIHDELSALIAAMDGAYKDKGMSERGHWLALYDGGPHTTDRINRGSTFVRNHSAAILGGITTDKLRGLISRMAADGLMARMSLVTMPASDPSDDLEPIPAEALMAYEKVVQRIVHNRPHKPKAIPMEEAARKLLGAAKKRWQSEALRQSEHAPRYAERLGKLPGLAARTALGLALIEAAEVPGNGYAEIDLPRVVQGGHMDRAVRLVDYLAGHDFAFYVGEDGDDNMSCMANARRVAGWILRHGKAEFKLGEITRGVLEWRSLKGIEQAGVLELLEQLGWIVAKTADNGSAFRGVSFVRGTRWVVNPRAHEQFSTRADHERRAAAERKAKLEAAVDDGQTTGKEDVS